MDYEEYKRKALEPIVNYIESVMASYSKEELEARIKKALLEKESEDERIRKALVKTFEKKLEIGFEWTEFSIPNRSVLDWLERKKEQQPVHTAKEMWKEMRLEVYAQASGNRHEPNYSDDSTKMFSLCDIDEIFEKIGNSTVGSQPAESDEIKGGDFISDGKRTFLVLANVKERNLGETRSTFCEGRILGVDGVVYCDGGDFKKFKRATSDERAKFIHDLKGGVELKEQPAEWSEEDEIIEKAICVLEANFEPNEDFSGLDITRCQLVERLKSLRPQPHWKPSQKQMDCLVVAASGYGNSEVADVLSSLINDLQKLL